MKCKCTDLLTQDHKVILRCLDVLGQMSVRTEKGVDVHPDDVEAGLQFLRCFADDYHQTKEESALFPVLLQSAAGQSGPVSHMLFEHDQERSLVEGLEDALRTKKGIDFVYYANRLEALLRNHIQKEDNILFEIVERSLSTEQDEKVVSEFEKFPIKQELFAALRNLEWKYMTKSA